MRALTTEATRDALERKARSVKQGFWETQTNEDVQVLVLWHLRAALDIGKALRDQTTSSQDISNRGTDCDPRQHGDVLLQTTIRRAKVGTFLCRQTRVSTVASGLPSDTHWTTSVQRDCTET
jgi:hypothetical protein